MTVTLARYLLIAIGIALIPVWKLWILGGWIADRRAQRIQRRRY
jgi:hypothetical protein